MRGTGRHLVQGSMTKQDRDGLRADIVRIGQDGGGRVHGHVTDPQTQERVTFQNWMELWQILRPSIDGPAKVNVQTDPSNEDSLD